MRSGIAEAYLLLCEGLQDKVFFENLFQARGISSFLVECPDKAEEGASGISQYSTYLSGLIARTRPNLRGLIITADCDENATERMAEITQWLTKWGYTPPIAPLAVMPSKAPPHDFALMVLLIPPSSTTGCLETLLYPAAANKWSALRHCVDSYWTCVGTASRTPNQESKIRLRALLAAAYPRNPNLTLTRIWNDPATSLPLDDPNFDSIADAVKAFCAQVPP